MPVVEANWSDIAGRPRVTSVLIEDGDASRPLVLLLHGASGTSADMLSPMTGPHASYLFDVHNSVPASIDRGWHGGPGVGWWSLGALDPPASGTGWAPFFTAHNYGVAAYDQVDNTGLLANPVLEMHG
jgi:hypothetical protein